MGRRWQGFEAWHPFLAVQGNEVAGSLGFDDAHAGGAGARAGQHGGAVKNTVGGRDQEGAVPYMLIDRGVGARHPLHDVLDITDNGEVILGGVEQLAQQLAFARVHLAEKCLAVGRLRGTVDQADQPGPHAVTDRLQQGGDQTVQLAPGQDRGFEHQFDIFVQLRPLPDGFQDHGATSGVAVKADAAGGGKVLQRLIEDAGVVFDGALKVFDGHFPRGGFRDHSAYRNMIIAAREQNQLCGWRVVGLGKVAVVLQKAVHADHGLFGGAAVVTHRDSSLANPEYPAGKHFRVDIINRLDQLAYMTGFHHLPPPGYTSDLLLV